MIRESFGTSQIKRLMRLPFAPGAPEDAKALTEEFRRVLRSCISEAHLGAVIDSLMDSCTRVPSPAEVAEAVRTVTAPDRAKAPLGCGTCQGTSWYSYTKRITSVCGTQDYDFADFCSCERGVWMRQMEKTRKEEEAAKQRSKGARL